MLDSNESDEPGGAGRALAYGAGTALAACAIFFLAYVIAPNVPIAWTCVLAVALGAIALTIVATLTTRARQPAFDQTTAGQPEEPELELVRDAHEPAIEPVAEPGTPSRPADGDDLQARAAALRETIVEKRRAKLPLEWADAQFALGETLYEIGMRGVMAPGRRDQRTGLGQIRQALGAYRRTIEERTRDDHPQAWAVTQIALAGCLQVLGIHEGDRQQLEESAISYAAALQVPQLTAAERAAAEAGLAGSEGALTDIAESERAERDDGFF